MPLRELLYYPPFVAVAGLGLAIVISFLVFIVHQRRRIRKMREGLRSSPPMKTVTAGQALETKPSFEAADTATAEPAPAAVSPAAIITPVSAEAQTFSAAPGAEASPPQLEPMVLSASPQSESPLVVPAGEVSTAILTEEVLPAASPQAAASCAAEAIPGEAQPGPSFRTFERESSIWADVQRGLLLLGSFLIAVTLVLLTMPQRTFDKMADDLRYRNANRTQEEMLAFLYLGDEIKGTEFHIRGVVRNITSKPIDELDATVRLYAPDRTLLETALVRMDLEHIEPNAIATFHLTYPDYHGQFGSYSIDFKLRQGEPVPYKDMRAVRAHD